MSNSLCFSPVASLNPRPIPVLIPGNCSPRKVEWIKDVTQSSKDAKFSSLEVKASNDGQNPTTTKRRSLLCSDCEGNALTVSVAQRIQSIIANEAVRIVQCKQCEGSGANIVDHFNGRFKAGALCWLCRGKKEILCGNCNGAGFMGGFMSAMED